MGRKVPIKVGLALALVVIATIDLAVSEDKCRSGCAGGKPQIFKYAEGTTYKYNLEGNIDISVSSAEGQQSTTKLKATVLLTQLPHCNQLLRLQNVQIIGPDAKKFGHIHDIEKAVQINFHDGHIEDVICAEPGDTQNSLNVKRAVASLFQGATKKHYETDVFGLCPTQISSHKEGNNVVISKVRHLNKCSHRESVQQDFLTTAFNLNSEIKSSPVLNGEYTSEQRIKNGILDHATVTEHYLFVPFSIGKNGATAVINTKLQFVSSSKETAPSSCTEPKSIIFENPHLVNTDKSNVDSILTALKETKKTIEETVSDNSAQEFTNLIKILRVSSKDDILAVYGQVRAGAGFKDKVGAKKIYLDALYRAGTGDTVEVGIELLKNKELNEVEQKLVFLSLAFVRHATLSSIESAAALLDQPNLPREAYLGVGTLAGRYCQQHSCKNVDALNKLLQKLLQKLGDGKADNREEENQIVSILKAIANVRLLNDAVVAKVISIAQDKKAPIRVRVAALETLHVEACKDKVRDSALSILKDVQQDSEIRIRAYLVVAQCPNGKVATALKTLLDNEPSYQVGGFIVSHLRNLRASANPDKEAAKQQLANIRTTKKFPVDIRKFSFNNEFSYTFDTLGVGSSVDTNVIYSQKSFLPRAGELNLTAEVFGHSVNFLQLGARQENLDRVLEHYFGPLGVLNTLKPDEVLTTGKETVDKLLQQIKDRISRSRGKRDVSKAEIDAFGKQVQIKTNQLNNDLDLDYTMKVFGSEIAFLSVNENSQQWSPEQVIDKLFDCLDKGIADAKNFEHIIQSNAIFLDSEFSYPTSLGYPLRLAVEGASSIQLKAAGSIDIKALLNRDQGTTFKLSLIPSANIEISGSLTLDAHLVESGLKVSSNLYTATGGDLEVDLFDKVKGIDIKFSLPVEKQKLISANHELVFNTRELGKPEVNQPIKFGQNKDFSVCLGQFVPFIGVAFCADINSPPVGGKHSPLLPFPLSGNGKFVVGIEREDLSQYHFKEILYNEPDRLGSEMVLEALDNNNQPKISLEIQAFYSPETYVRATVMTPVGKALAEGRVINTDNEKSVSVKLAYDQNEFFSKVGVAISGGGDRSVYKPLIEYRTPNGKDQPPLQVEGAVIREKNGGDIKYTFDNVKVTVPDHGTFSLNGNTGVDREGLYIDITGSDGRDSATFKGKSGGHDKEVNIEAELTTSKNPQANVKVVYKFKNPIPTSFDSDLEITHGADLSSKKNRLTLKNSLFSEYKKIDNYKFSTENKLVYPAVGLLTELDFESTPKSLQYDVEFEYGKLKVGSELDLKVAKKDSGDFEIDFEVHGLDNKIEIDAKREVQGGDKSKIENCLTINGKKYEVDGIVTHRIKPSDINVGSDLVIKIHGVNEPIQLNDGLVLNDKELDTHLKISSGSIVYVDSYLKANKNGNADGRVTVTIKDILLVNGQLKAVQGVGSGDILIDFGKLNRKVKGETTFTIADPTLNILTTIYPDFERDNNKKITISTTNEIKLDSIDSKNFIEILDKKLEVNYKGSAHGSFTDGKVNAEGEIILPTDHYFSGKIDRTFTTVNGITNGDGIIVLEQRDNKNTPGRKFILKVDVKNTNIKENTFEITHNVILENGNKENINADFSLSRFPKGDEHAVEGKLKIYGSKITNPLEIDGNVIYKNLAGNYQLLTHFGPKAALNVNGKYNVVGAGHPLMGEISVEVSTPSAEVHTVKFSAGGSILKNENVEEYSTFEGSVGLFVDDNNSQNDPRVDINANVQAKARLQDGQIKGSLNFQKEDPIDVSLGYERSNEGGVKKLKSNFAVDYAHGKKVSYEWTITRPNDNEYNLDYVLHSNGEVTKVEVHSTKSEDGRSSNSKVVVILPDNRKYVLTSDVQVGDVESQLDFQLTCPSGKVEQLAVKVYKHSPKDFGGELKILSPEHNFLLEGSLDAKLENIDNFLVKVTANSPALKLDHLEVEAQSKPAKGGKRIQITASEAGKNFLTGSTSYKAREEGGKYIIEGSGSFKIHEETKQSNFKFIRQHLNLAKHGEEGFEISLNAALGNEAVDAELKVTNKHFRYLNSYCEEKHQCAHIEIDSKTDRPDYTELNNEVEIAIDLRKLGLSHEFGLKAVTTRKDFVLDHNVDVYFQSKDNKYQYSLYVHPTEAGASLTTPKRVISAEAEIQLPGSGHVSPITGSLVLYLNKKNNPNEKTALTAVIDYNYNDKVGGVNAEFKFTNPALEKDLCVHYISKYDVPHKNVEFNLDIDIFAQPNQKIIVNGKTTASKLSEKGYSANSVVGITSQGLNIDIRAEENWLIEVGAGKHAVKYSTALSYDVANSKYDSGVHLEATPQKINILVNLLNKELVKVDSQIQVNKDSQVVDTDVCIIGIEPTVSHLEIKNLNRLTLTVSRKNNPNDKLVINSGIIPGQIADFRAEVYKNGAKNDLVLASVKLDDSHFLKTDYKLNAENVQKLLLEPIRHDVTNFLKESKGTIEESIKTISSQVQQVLAAAKRNAPNLKPLKEYYARELETIRQELVSDKTIKEIAEVLRKVFGSSAEALSALTERVSKLVQQLDHIFEEQFSKLLNVITKEVIPQLNEIADSICRIGADIVEKLLDVAFIYIAKLSQFIDEHQAEIKQFVTAVSAITQEVARLVIKIVDQASVIISKEWKDLSHEFKAIPGLEELKTKLKEIVQNVKVSDGLINTIKNIAGTIKDAIPNEDIKNLITETTEYIEKKLRQQPVDDAAVIEHIIETGIRALKKIIAIITSEGKLYGFEEKDFTLSFNLLHNLPKLVAAKFSPFSYLLAGDIPTFLELITDRSLNPEDWLPPFRLNAVIAQGQHIFTFDGKHLTFPGKCDYLLARDAVNGNFSVVGTFTDGILSSITVSDKHDEITLKKGGQLLLNGAATEWPARKSHIHAYRTYESLNVDSKAGLHLICGVDLLVCGVHVSGFYHGQLRGLLGNGNNEPYDDYTTPNGKIVTSESDFGNSYKIDANCPAVQTVDHSVHQHNPSCSKLFGPDSDLKYCYNFVKPNNYRMACDHGTAAGVKDTEKAIAIAYVASCVSRYIPIRVPDEFLQCENSQSPVDYDTTFSVKTPGKAADVVVVVDQIKSNEPVYKDLVQPLLTQLTQELNGRGINDIEFHLIGYGGEEQHWPSHITSGGKLTFKGKAPNLKFSEEPKKPVLSVGCPKADKFLQLLQDLARDSDLATGRDLSARTYGEALEYPFRAHAVKSVIVITGKPCEQGRFLAMQKVRALLYHSNQITLTLVTPFDDLVVKDAKQTKNVIGFNLHNVFTLADAKKKPEGVSDLHKELSYNDYCVDFTLKNRGNVFVTNNFLQAKGGAKKQFIQVAAHNIVEQLTNVEQGLDCKCIHVSPYTAQNVCRVTYSKDKPTPTKKGGVKS